MSESASESAPESGPESESDSAARAASPATLPVGRVPAPPAARDPLLPRGAYRHWHRIGTLWADNDLYGHVNNTVHYRWFDTVVNSWLIGAGLLDIRGGDPIGLVVETGCRYAGSVAYPDPVEIGLRIDRIGGSSVTYRLGVFREGAVAAAAEGHFTHVYVDRSSRRPVPVPEPWRARLEALLASA